MPQLNAYLSFDRNCAEAMRFYERVLGGSLTAMMTYGQSPMAGETRAEDRDLVMHAHLQHPDFVIMGGDATSGMPYQRPQGRAEAPAARASALARLQDRVEAGL